MTTEDVAKRSYTFRVCKECGILDVVRESPFRATCFRCLQIVATRNKRARMKERVGCARCGEPVKKADRKYCSRQCWFEVMRSSPKPDKKEKRESKWTQERVEQMKQLWRKGLTSREIAAAMNCGLSRNAVLAKIYRLKNGEGMK